MASQMSNAVYDTVSIDDRSAAGTSVPGQPSEPEIRRASLPSMKRARTTRQEEKQARPLPESRRRGRQFCTPGHWRSSSTFTQPPARYTEATLVKAMEEKGVGRPSQPMRPSVSTIQDREYVIKKDKRLMPHAPG